ncbi:hypothetical protein ACFSJ3_03755 [Corallincola platygyrae]|uniref:STAS/SEC14 domain-containing protein n=1 Tax=Corallincola platygyrae TaxID=1193278 RepID=A0ABW4XHR9_9GAMM
MFVSHGSYQIVPLDSGRIIKVIFTGAWNKEAVAGFFQDMKTCPKADIWVAMADLRDWEGATPDLIAAYMPVIDWCLANGECATVHVYKHDWQRLFVDKLRAYREQQGVPQASFQSEAGAIAWANSQLDEVTAKKVVNSRA